MAAATGACRIAGVDLATLGWRFGQAEGVRAMPRLEPLHRPMPGRRGHRRTGRSAQAVRTIVLRGTLDARTPETIEAVRDAVLGIAASGPVTIEVATRPGVAWVGELTDDSVTHFGPQRLARYPSHTLTFACASPFALDTEPRTVGWTSSSDPAVIECGTAPSDITVRVYGPATNPDVVCLDCRGVEVARLAFNVVLADGDWLVASSETFRVTKVVAGVATDAASTLADGSRFFAVDPLRDADRAGGAWPLIHSTSGTGDVSYRRAWL